jgi:CRP-like cAMP-binding protein
MTQAEQFLKKLPLFEKCSSDDVQRLALNMRWLAYKKGDTILFQGMISHQMFFILTGRAAVFTRKDRETRRVADLEAGSYFGEISLLTNRAATATIKADEEDTQIYVLERDAVIEALSRNPEAMADITAKVQERNQGRQEAFRAPEAEPAAVPA